MNLKQKDCKNNFSQIISHDIVLHNRRKHKVLDFGCGKHFELYHAMIQSLKKIPEDERVPIVYTGVDIKDIKNADVNFISANFITEHGNISNRFKDKYNDGTLGFAVFNLSLREGDVTNAINCAFDVLGVGGVLYIVQQFDMIPIQFTNEMEDKGFTLHCFFREPIDSYKTQIKEEKEMSIRFDHFILYKFVKFKLKQDSNKIIRLTKSNVNNETDIIGDFEKMNIDD